MSETLSETQVLINTSNLKSEPIDRPHSPESNCAICLEGFTNKSFTNSCLHQFCFNCLKEWSKIKPECPLCKQRFHTIIHNVRSLNDFDEYHVNTSNVEYDQTVFINFAFPANPYSMRNGLDLRRHPIDFRQRVIEPEVFRGSMSTTSSMLYIRELNGLLATDTIHSSTLPVEPDFRAPNLGLSRYRRDIYRRGRWVRPAQSSRIRQSSPEFYRLNTTQTHRLVPWLTRELNVLLDVSIDPQNLVQEILNLITMHPIQSRHFREAMRPHLGERTEHFIHEFYHFAVSPHDIVSYDIMAEYGPQDTRPQRLAREESSESDSDVEIVNILRGNYPVLNGLDLTTRPGPSSSVAFSETVIEISDSSNSDHEVEIVGMISPVTPETILIESTDDEMGKPDINVTCTVKNESPIDLIKDSIIDHDFDPNQPSSSNSDGPSRYNGFSLSSKENTSNSSSSSSRSLSSSSRSLSSSSYVYTSSLSSVSDSEYDRKNSSLKRKRKKYLKRDRVKRHRRKMRIVSSSSDEDISSKKILQRRIKSVVVKAENKSVLSGSFSESE